MPLGQLVAIEESWNGLNLFLNRYMYLEGHASAQSRMLRLLVELQLRWSPRLLAGLDTDSSPEFRLSLT